MLKGLKVLLTGPEVLFAGVDGWLSMNFFYYSCFDVDMREQFRCSGNRLVATCSSNEAWFVFERTWELDRGEMNCSEKVVLCAFRWSWAVPERSGDVPGGSRARIIDF